MGFILVKGEYQYILNTLEVNKSVLSKSVPIGTGVAHTPAGSIPYMYNAEAQQMCFNSTKHTTLFLVNIFNLPPIEDDEVESEVTPPEYYTHTEGDFSQPDDAGGISAEYTTQSFVKPTIKAEGTANAEGSN